ncbi:DUF748 domain-containing protein [Maridesulfovibrio salexigens]|uniref:AsmA family protein n=1 Tax=Maridesulfovibrio salexigens (strain ATCC 14822 / DSM 2638 / NCIMB 8403 / VKM B-1763) TaxID=526222 RepID=C6BU12_MARSD|nr:DUF748 domain-containing protein [Maridesulfovibrio salexigens]ACS81721.1 protein of unknown function DUF748 [Maridesulfovibrio salexigens DSM 2638]
MLKKIRTHWNRLNRPGKVGLIVAGLLIFYTIIGFLLIPFTIKKVALSKLPAVLNRDVRIEQVDLNPYTLQLTVHGFEIGKKEGEGNLFSFKTFDLNLDSFSLFRLSLILDEIKIVDPQIDLAVFRGGSSVSDLIPEGDVEEQPEEANTDEKELFPFIVRDLVVSNGTCRVYDKVRDVRHEISSLDLFVPFTSSLLRDNEKQVQPSLDMIINGTPFALKGHTLPFNQSLKTQFDFSLKDAQLAEYWPYLPIYETTELKSGSLSSDLVLSFERGDTILPRVQISGKANITNFDLAARKGPSLLKFKDLDVELEEVRILQRILKISSVNLSDPYLKVGLKEDGSPDLLDYLAPSIEAGEKSKETEGGSKEESGPAVAALVRDFRLDNGQVDFTDNAFGKGFNKKIGPIMVHAGNVSTAENAAGSWDFRIGSNATEVISGQGGLSVIPLSVNGSIAVEDLDIPDYHVYLDDPLPLDVAGGKVGLGSDFQLGLRNETSVRLKNIRVNVDGLDLQPKGGGKTLIGLGGFAMNNGTVDLQEKSVFIDSIDLNKLLIRLMRDKKGIDLIKQIEQHQKNAKNVGVPVKQQEEGADSADAEGETWKVALNRFQLSESGVELTDRAATKKTVTSISDIKIGVNGLTFPEEKPLKLNLSALINKRGSIKIDGQAGPQSLKGKGSVQLRKLRLRDFNGYLPPQMQMNIARGHVDVRGNWDFSAANEPVAGYTGKVQLKDLLIRDNQGNKQFFHLEDLAVREIDFRSAPLKVKVGSIAVLAPKANLEREQDGTFNIARMLTGKRAEPVDEEALEEQAELAAEKAAVATKEGSPPVDGVAELKEPTAEEKQENVVAIDEIFMSNGTVSFKDYTVSPAFELDISKMRSAVRGLELPHGERTDISFNATLDRQSPLVAEGYLQPTVEGADTDINVSVANLDMTQLSPYTEKFIAYPVSTGMLSSDVCVKLRGKFIAVNNVFDIYQFEVGKKVDNPDAPNIPIGLGLALLRDSSGNIRLDIPVEGDLSDPQFKLGKVIARAIVNLLVKAVTSPFALIGALVGGGEDMDVMAFEAGKVGFKEGEQSKMESVAKAMQDRPGLKLEVSGFTAPEDIPAMEEAEFRRQVAMPKFLELEGDENAPKSVDDVVITEEEYPEYLEAAYKDATFERPTNFLGIVVAQPVPDMEKALRDHIKVTDTQLADLARRRSELVRTFLVEQSGIAPERVFLKGMSATGKGTGPRVELGLQ